MKKYSGLERKDTIKLVQNIPTEPSVVFVDSRVCLIDSLINELVKTGLFGQVHSCNTISDLISETQNSSMRFNMVVMSLDILNLSSQDQQIDTIRSKFGPNTQLVFLADKPCIDLVRYMDKHDINGIIPSSYNAKQAIACLKAIDSGIRFIPPTLLTEKLDQPSVAGLINKNINHELRESLTPRQAQVLELLYVGRSNKYIAAELSLCESTVKVHVSEIMKRLGATSRTHASYLYTLMTETEES